MGKKCVVLLGACCLFFGGCGGGGSSAPPPIQVTVTPATANVALGGQQQFNATVTGASNQAVTWAVVGGAANGSISATGLYTAPATVPNPAQVTVTATSQVGVASGSATVTVTGPTVTVTPPTANVAIGGQQQFSASVSGTSNQNVTWAVVGGAANGSISSAGLYTAPASVPNPPQVTVTATSAASGASGSATVTVTGPTVTVMPNPAAVGVFQAQQFVASVSGPNGAVTWQVNGVTGGSATTGTISATGVFTGPHSVPVQSVGGQSQTTTVTVTAISTPNPGSSGSATVTITLPPGQQTDQAGPVRLGTSGGNKNDTTTSGTTITCCSGTLGSLVTRGGTQFILSNNHVMARSDLGVKTSGATTGDPIIQPGLVDSRCGQDLTLTVANLTDFYNLETGTGTKIDAAIAQVVPNQVDSGGNIFELGATATNGVPDPGTPHQGSGVAAAVNMSVAKSGRSTGLTCSTVTATNVNTNVQYQKGCGSGTRFTVSFTGQIMVAGGAFSAGGDSGSLIVDQTTAEPVALLFAGSDADTVGNPISAVLNFFSTAGNPMTFVGSAAQHQVIGCTGPFPLTAARTVPNSLATQVSSVTAARMQHATAVRDAHGPELIAHTETQAVGVGASYDNPEEPAILFFVTRGASRMGIPAEVDGVRTRIIEGELFAHRGILSAAESTELEQSVSAPRLVYSLADAEMKRAQVVHAAHVDEWMTKAGVQGVGITSSADAPGEAALLIYLIRGAEHPAIPATIDGLRTRVREGSRFKAGLGGPANGSCKVPGTQVKTAARAATTETKH